VRGAELEAQGIVVEYGREGERHRALDGVSVRVAPGEIVALLGPNGAGKSTLLRVLALMQRPAAGEVYLDKLAALRLGASAVAQLRRRIGLVPDTPFVFNLLTGRELLEYVGELYGRPRAEVRERAEQVLALFGLGDAADCFVRTYSQGMLKKLSIAAALVLEADVLLLDEPSNSLDPDAVITLRETLAEHRRAGAAIVVSTHLLDLAERLADRVLLLDRGQVVHTTTLQATSHPSVSALERLYRQVMGS
jgi:ABC-2 type transport system ATP-binding protein